MYTLISETNAITKGISCLLHPPKNRMINCMCAILPEMNWDILQWQQNRCCRLPACTKSDAG